MYIVLYKVGRKWLCHPTTFTDKGKAEANAKAYERDKNCKAIVRWVEEVD